MSSKKIFLLLISLIGSISYLDHKIAFLIGKYYSKTNIFYNSIVYIPNIVLYLSGFISTIIIFTKFKYIKSKFSQIIFMISYSNFVTIVFIKILKMIFSRTGPNYLIKNNNIGIINEFHWFKIGNLFREFPSGHSASIATIFTVLYLFFPKYKYIYYIIVLLVSFSLLIRNDHYLSSIILGNVIGYIISKKILEIFYKIKIINID